VLDMAVLCNDHLLPSVRGNRRSKLGRAAGAGSEFERAARLAANAAERAHLLARAGSS
jgi:predicted RNA polymerase sigma factor